MAIIPKVNKDGYFKLPDGSEMRITINNEGNIIICGDNQLWTRSRGDNGIEIKQHLKC